MLLVVDVSGKKYIVETEDYQDLSSENDDTISRGYLKIKSNVCTIFIQITCGGKFQKNGLLKMEYLLVGSKREIN